MMVQFVRFTHYSACGICLRVQLILFLIPQFLKLRNLIVVEFFQLFDLCRLCFSQHVYLLPNLCQGGIRPHLKGFALLVVANEGVIFLVFSLTLKIVLHEVWRCAIVHFFCSCWAFMGYPHRTAVELIFVFVLVPATKPLCPEVHCSIVYHRSCVRRSNLHCAVVSAHRASLPHQRAMASVLFTVLVTVVCIAWTIIILFRLHLVFPVLVDELHAFIDETGHYVLFR
mmetsp:Transcript_13957/g.28205  ORF Transcript_13957/g.28205 Transcript_13957/m.28205 type:complete len:227 (+) Transcript_13957:185-865(+)